EVETTRRRHNAQQGPRVQSRWLLRLLVYAVQHQAQQGASLFRRRCVPRRRPAAPGPGLQAPHMVHGAGRSRLFARGRRLRGTNAGHRPTIRHKDVRHPAGADRHRAGAGGRDAVHRAGEDHGARRPGASAHSPVAGRQDLCRLRHSVVHRAGQRVGFDGRVDIDGHNGHERATVWTGDPDLLVLVIPDRLLDLLPPRLDRVAGPLSRGFQGEPEVAAAILHTGGRLGRGPGAVGVPRGGVCRGISWPHSHQRDVFVRLGRSAHGLRDVAAQHRSPRSGASPLQAPER
ncbi:hypothetical protein HK405_008626, partial [Cladochytrium tenue]